jgi:hypothetical protein
VSRANLDIDPELDVMLAELENDEDFQKMTDNEQVSDTCGNGAMTKLNPDPKTKLFYGQACLFR